MCRVFRENLVLKVQEGHKASLAHRVCKGYLALLALLAHKE